VTGRNKLIARSLFVVVSMQVCFGIVFTIRIGMTPCKFPDRSFMCTKVHSVTSSALSRDELGRV